MVASAVPAEDAATADGGKALNRPEAIAVGRTGADPGTESYDAVYVDGGIELTTPSGLVCAGELRDKAAKLQPGTVIPIECADGNSGRVKIMKLSSAEYAEGICEITSESNRTIAISLAP